MSNGVQIFVNMKSCIFLIILLGFVRLIFCSKLANVAEVTEHGAEVCPVTWSRRKRSNGEYTRWRFNVVTTPEFIVKVLDDDMMTRATSPVLAMNIIPVTNRVERIVVGGAIVQPQTSATTEQTPRDYTRFVPPTTTVNSLANNDGYHLSTLNLLRDVILPLPHEPPSVRKEAGAPVPPPNILRSANRDESPPARPQFLPRSMQHTVPARQYAPITPVAFTRTTTVTPLTPPNDFLPTRSATSTNPMRTDPFAEFFHDFVADELENDLVLTRSTLKGVPLRTSSLTTSELFDDDIDHYYSPKDKDHDFTPKSVESKTTDPDHLSKDDQDNNDAYYHNMFFYDSDYKDSNDKNETEDIHRNKTPIFVKSKIENIIVPKVSTMMKLVSDKPSLEGAQINSTEEMQYPEETFEITGNFTEVPDNETSADKKHLTCDMIKLRPLSFSSPRTLPEIVYQLKEWTEESPVAKWADITEGNLTTMENPIYVMIVDDPSVGQVASEKQNVLLVAGILGRDHLSVTGAMYVLYQLIDHSEKHKHLLSKYRFWIIPVFNPDGYDYSMTFPSRRDWVKNLRQTWDPCKGRESCKHCSTYGIRCTVSPCYGVNLDRNFEYQWIPPEELRAEHPCGNLYAGSRQMSEAETQALNHFIHSRRLSIAVFLALKEGDILGVMYPYSHTKKKRAFDQIYRQRANRAAAAAFGIAGRPYVAGQTSEFLPLYAGGIEDWADGHHGIDNTYTIMVFRPTDTPLTNFLTEVRSSCAIMAHHCFLDNLFESLYETDWQSASQDRDNWHKAKDFAQQWDNLVRDYKVIHEAYAATDSLLLSTLSNNKAEGGVGAGVGGGGGGGGGRSSRVLTLTKAKSSSLHPNLNSVLFAILASFTFSKVLVLPFKNTVI